MSSASSDEPNPIRDIIYAKLEKITEKNIQERFLHGDGPQMITEIIKDCMGDILALSGKHDEKVGTMATVLLHYLCTNLLIPTQRKTTLDDVYIDLVIPDTKTLKTNWNSSLVLCILTSTKKNHIEERIADAKKIQPNRENIWIISPMYIDSEYKTFVINSEQNSFSCIIDEINRFLDKAKSGKFRIFKAV